MNKSRDIVAGLFTASPRARAAKMLTYAICTSTILLVGLGQIWSAEEESDHTVTLRLLEGRKQQQITAAQKFQAFYSFQFSDRIAESGIRF